MNELQERIESKVITKTFHVSGMPLTVWKELDEFCKENYGDSRWSMLNDMMRFVKQDYRFEMLYSELMTMKEHLARIESSVAVDKEENKPKSRFTTFGEA